MAALQNPTAIRFGRFELQKTERQLLVNGQPTKLGARAFDILLTLIERRERLITKRELLDLVWPGLVVEENNLQVHISTLRRILGPGHITTIAGRGYRFSARLDNAGLLDAPEHVDQHGGTADERAGSDTQPSPHPHNLPTPRDRFIGREDLLAQCATLLAQTRLLTLTGIGGSGKTRIATQLARRQLERFPGGVWMVDLAPLPNAAAQDDHVIAAAVAAAVAAALGVHDDASTPILTRVVARLATLPTLLVLDNCEHVAAAVAATVDALLNSCAALVILATSRQSLMVASEQVLLVPQLTLPAAPAHGTQKDTTQTDTAQRHTEQRHTEQRHTAHQPDERQRSNIADSEAVQLFVERARMLAPEFALTADNERAVADVCTGVDGIALAIELAAARVQMLSVTEIAARLRNRFRLLEASRPTAPRHQTLTNALLWSYDSLTSAEQQLFRALGVFPGGCTLAAAHHVCTGLIDTSAADAGALAPPDDYATLELLTQLHNKSLLLVEHSSGGSPCYRMLETVRQFALAQLQAAQQTSAVRDLHLRYYVQLAADAETTLHGPQQGAFSALLRREQENLLAAHSWCEQARDAESALRLVVALWRYWITSAQLKRGHALAVAAIALADETQPLQETQHQRLRCQALWVVGQLAFRMGLYAQTLTAAEQSLAIAHASANTEQIAAGMCLVAKALHATGATAEALSQ